MPEIHRTNTDRFYKGLLDILTSDHATSHSDCLGWRDRVDGIDFTVDDYNGCYLDKPPEDEAERKSLLRDGIAWISIRNTPVLEPAEQPTGLDYQILRPSDWLATAGSFIVDMIRTHSDRDLDPDQPIIYRLKQEIVVADPFTDSFLQGVHMRVGELLG